MAKSVSPTFRIAIGLVGITLSLVMATHILGILPDERHLEVRARSHVAESLAVQLSSAVARSDAVGLYDTMQAVVKRNKNVLSIALRRRDGKILLEAGDHEAVWEIPHESRSTPTHIQVPLSDGDEEWGKIEITFAPLSSSEGLAGLPKSLWAFIAFLGGWGLFGYYFVLSRALRELDPGKAIPDRVQSAFNTLAEGVLILDERGFILLANDAFADAVAKPADDLFGSNVSDLQWRRWGEGDNVGNPPWQKTINEGQNITGAKLGYKTSNGQLKNFVINATRILDKSEVVTGVIVTFDDVTALERKNDDLILAVRRLQKSEEEISQQNRELQYLANHDPLSGCLNRRAFFETFADVLERAYEEGSYLTCLMADLDHFKRINDTYGHGVGDDVISGMAKILLGSCGEDDIVGRYGGEEFCIALVGRSPEESHAFAERVRATVARQSLDWLKDDDKITSSIGIATLPDHQCSVKEIVDWADQALYQAKETGRNKVVFWDAEQQSALPTLEGYLDLDETQAAVDAPKVSLKPVQATNLFHDKPASVTTAQALDPLTKLPNQVIFNDRLAQALVRADKDNKIVSVLQVSIASIEGIANAFGDQVCRDVIAIVSTRFAAALKRSDTLSIRDAAALPPSLSHKGNGTFFVEIADLDETNTIVWLIRRLFDSLSAPITVGEHVIHASADIGISLYPADGRDLESLLRNAEQAQKASRLLTGTNRYQFFSEEMNTSSQRQMSMEAGIREAIDQNQFKLAYQPIIDAKSGRLRALETLLRSDHPEFAGMPIGSLIAVAEQTGLIVEIGEWVLKTAIYQAESWMEQGMDIPRLSVNLSAVQLNNHHAMDRLIDIVMGMKLPTRRLQFEITETAILRDVEAAGAALMRLQQLGVLIALDDFGTGQSSISYLRRFRPDVLKIDRCFVGDITTSIADENLVSAIVVMSQRMNIRVVAEGVETVRQMEKVRDIGCDEIQGFFFSKPMSTEATGQWLLEHNGKSVFAKKAGKQERRSKSA